MRSFRARRTTLIAKPHLGKRRLLMTTSFEIGKHLPNIGEYFGSLLMPLLLSNDSNNGTAIDSMDRLQTKRPPGSRITYGRKSKGATRSLAADRCNLVFSCCLP
jgi:hypothetical protein